MSKQRSSAGLTNIQRRRLISLMALSGCGLGSLNTFANTVNEASSAKTGALANPWAEADEIVRRVTVPLQFPSQTFSITDFGAKPCPLKKVQAWISFEEQALTDTPADDAFDCYASIAAAIRACHDAGGGKVIVPRGDWYVAGPVVLLSYVHFHLESGAQLYFSHRPEDYAKYGDVDCGANGKLSVSRWQSNDCLNYTPMIYAINQHHIALTGEDWTSVLNGQGGVPFNEEGDCWWTWKGKLKTHHAVGQNSVPHYREGASSENTINPLNATSLSTVGGHVNGKLEAMILGQGDQWRADANYLPALSEAKVAIERRVFGKGHYLRPPMIQFIHCQHVWLENYEVRNTPFWQHHPVHCEDLLIRKVHAKSHGPNNDGFDPEACRYVVVDQCIFDTGDDCIAIKAGKNNDTQYGPSEHIVIQQCTMQSGHGGVTLGSEMAGGIQYVYARDLLLENLHWATNPLNTAIRLKTNLNRGGFLRHFYVNNIQIPNGVQTSPSFYSSLPGSPIRSKTVATAAGAIITFDCDYTPNSDQVRIRPPVVEDIYISNVTAGNVATASGQHSCYQAIVILGPVASDYNGPAPAPAVLPVKRVRVSQCDFGTPVEKNNPIYLYNVADLTLKDVHIDGHRMDGVYTA